MSIDNKLYQDIEKAIKIINLKFYQTINEYSKYSSLYTFTNENIDAAYRCLNLEDKKVLTVAGSGDHIFNAYLHGAKEVISFDVNVFSKYFIELKKAALVTLNKEEFISFFCKDYNTGFCSKLFNEQLYLKIHPNLEYNSRIFWDTLFHHFTGGKIRYSKLFNSTEETINFLLKTSTYLQGNNYRNMQKILRENNNIFCEQKFLNTSLTNIPKTTSDKFDIIYLSNIPDYISEIYSRSYIENFKIFLEKELCPMLNENGKIMVSYMFYSDHLNQNKIPIINRKNIRKNYFKDCYKEIVIDNSMVRDTTNDRILIYKKTR